jgi:hypothetical protein
VFGIRASGFLADRFGDRVLACWSDSRPSLLHPLPDAPRQVPA